MAMQTVFVKENSFIAKLGAKILRVNNMALTIGNTIYLYNATKQNLLENKTWLCHELVHVQQYKQLGVIKFLFLYLKEWVINGYTNNRFEVEARAKERELKILQEFKVG
jgi:hypothetical protein